MFCLSVLLSLVLLYIDVLLCWFMSISFTLCGGYLDKTVKDEETHRSLCSTWPKLLDEVLTLRRRVQLEKQ